MQEAIKEVQSLAAAKFDESVEIAIRLGIDPRRGDQVGCCVMTAGSRAQAGRQAGKQLCKQTGKQWQLPGYEAPDWLLWLGWKALRQCVTRWTLCDGTDC